LEAEINLRRVLDDLKVLLVRVADEELFRSTDRIIHQDSKAV
jgi:hypothetical protein